MQQQRAPTMEADELEPWIVSRYGPIAVAKAAGVFVCVVPTYGGGTAIGLGSNRINALADLYLELSARTHPVPVAGGLKDWEQQRRQDRARQRN